MIFGGTPHMKELSVYLMKVTEKWGEWVIVQLHRFPWTCLSGSLQNSCHQWVEMGWRIAIKSGDREQVCTANHLQIPHSSVMLSICRNKCQCYLSSSVSPPKHSLELFPPVTSCFLLVLLPTSELVLSVEGDGTLKSLRVWSVTCGFVSHQPSGHRWQQKGLYMGWAMCAMASQAWADHSGRSVLCLLRGVISTEPRHGIIPQIRWCHLSFSQKKRFFLLTVEDTNFGCRFVFYDRSIMGSLKSSFTVSVLNRITLE